MIKFFTDTRENKKNKEICISQRFCLGREDKMRRPREKGKQKVLGIREKKQVLPIVPRIRLLALCMVFLHKQKLTDLKTFKSQ